MFDRASLSVRNPFSAWIDAYRAFIEADPVDGASRDGRSGAMPRQETARPDMR